MITWTARSVCSRRTEMPLNLILQDINDFIINILSYNFALFYVYDTHSGYSFLK